MVRRPRANLERVAAALKDLNARLRVAGMTDEDAMALPVRIDPTTLDRAGMITWMTDAGPSAWLNTGWLGCSTMASQPQRAPGFGLGACETPGRRLCRDGRSLGPWSSDAHDGPARRSSPD